MNPPPTSLPITSLRVIPMHQPQACCILRQTDWRFNSYMIVYMLECHSPKCLYDLEAPAYPLVAKCLICFLPTVHSFTLNTISLVMLSRHESPRQNESPLSTPRILCSHRWPSRDLTGPQKSWVWLSCCVDSVENENRDYAYFSF